MGILERLMQRALDADRARTLHPHPVRALFWGLLCFSILMLFVAWAGIGELVVPPTPGPGIRLVDMPAPLLALNVALCALPPAALILILAGVSGMMRVIPSVGQRMVWRVGRDYVTAVRFAAFIVLAYAGLFVALIALTAVEFAGSTQPPVAGLAASLALATIPIALGWYLMFLAGWSLSAVTGKFERLVVRLAVAWAGAFAALLVAAEVFATIAMGASAWASDAVIPPRVPWADAASGVSGLASVVILALVARRVSHREETGIGPTPEPA